MKLPSAVCPNPPKIAAATFSAYLHCATKGSFIDNDERPPDTFFHKANSRILRLYKSKIAKATQSKAPIAIYFKNLSDHRFVDGSIFVDCDNTFCLCDQHLLLGRLNIDRSKSDRQRIYVPILYSAWEKITEADYLLVTFGALAVAQATGKGLPPVGNIVHGATPRLTTFKVAKYLSKTLQAIKSILSLRDAPAPPPLVLNKHCPVCDFQKECRSTAIDRDQLPLLGAMTTKELGKYEEKGITTITQLSYGYRPRRRRHRTSTTRNRSPLIKHDHKLKALAIKKGTTHVMGEPTFAFEGTPVFLDVEGVPDRNFYYLIGIRYELDGLIIEKHFWADQPANEESIWKHFIDALKDLPNPRMLHYGAYERRFFSLMQARWELSSEDANLVNRIIEGATNLLAIMYGRIYFPTYSNSLKEIARWLGFEWTWAQASGNAAILLRRAWELSFDDQIRSKLIEYNMDDCRALAVVANALALISGKGSQAGAGLETVNVSSLEVSFQRTYGKLVSALPEFEKINTSAYWDYQRSKVYVRADKKIKKIQSDARKAPSVHVDKELLVADRPESCLKCGESIMWINKRMVCTVVDLKFSNRGIKRWTVRYRYNSYKCCRCKAEITIFINRRFKYGERLRSYILHLLMEMRLSRKQICKHVSSILSIPISSGTVQDIKSAMATKYEITHRQILNEIVNGPLVHVDETKGVVYGGGHYVWIFANMTSIAYVYAESREASILDDLLANFRGVLVSDFYGGYDAVPCKQQKCLIHLMRDINEDVLKYPFNEEVGFIARQFGATLRAIIATIDEYGLRARHLRRHNRDATRFVERVEATETQTEAGLALKKRIIRNRERLFTFLNHDNVPWNNNNAEHAVRAFTRLRNVMMTSTPKGTKEYCILLSVEQTLRCRKLGFLDFLRSGRLEVGWR